MKFDQSSLTNYHGSLIVDAHSNQYLNLTLLDAQGTIHGLVAGRNTTQAIQITINDSEESRRRNSTVSSKAPKEYRVKVKVTGVVCEQGLATVVLYPSGSKGHLNNIAGVASGPLKKKLPCVESKMRIFRDTDGSNGVQVSQHTVFDRHRDCLTCSYAWSHWMNPFNWGQSQWSATRVAISLVMAIVAIFVMMCCIKFFCCCCK